MWSCCGEPGIAGAAAPLAVAAAREPRLIVHLAACGCPVQRSGGTGTRAEAGISVVVAGAILALPGMAGHAAGGRRHYCTHYYY